MALDINKLHAEIVAILCSKGYKASFFNCWSTIPTLVIEEGEDDLWHIWHEVNDNWIIWYFDSWTFHSCNSESLEHKLSVSVMRDDREDAAANVVQLEILLKYRHAFDALENVFFMEDCNGVSKVSGDRPVDGGQDRPGVGHVESDGAGVHA